MPHKLPIPELITHTRRVQALYKAACRNLRSFYYEQYVARYHLTVLRARFDENKCIQDTCQAMQLVKLGESELEEKTHWHVMKYMESPGGSAFAREVHVPDLILDYWHPLEKAQYPDYFARREQRKKEYIKLWEEKHGHRRVEEIE